MSTIPNQPHAYRPGKLARLKEGLRYQGGIGQWSWLLHRVTGMGILIFLVIHVVDTFFVVFNPALYDHTVAIYGGVFNGEYYWPLRWAFRLAELGLMATVLFHAINGVRVILFDFWSDGCKYQKESFYAVLLVFLALMLPAAVIVTLPLASSPDHVVKVPENVPAR